MSDAASASEVKVTAVGGEVAVVLPPELLAWLGVGAGDTLFAAEIEGGVRLSAVDPGHEARMAVARRVMKKRRAVLRELAK